ncbi:retrovirus-related pol polyprotein from transposon TNT 1-94 [Tanacetum coccineum]
MAAGRRKPEGQWPVDERKAANLDQRLKSLIMFVLPDDQMNSVINCLTVKSTWDDLILYHEGPSDVKESRVMDLKLCYNTFKFKEGESLTQTFTRYKALMNELVNDGIKLSKLEINTGFINGLPKKWLSFCQSLRNTNHVKDSELASLFDNPNDEEDTRSSHKYLNDLEEEYQARALLAKSKRFFKKGTQRFSSAKATDQTECHKCGKKGHFARDCWSKTSVLLYQSPFQPKLLHSSEHKPEPRLTKDFEAKYNKVKAKLALLSSSALAPILSSRKNKGLIVETYDWDEEEVSSDDNEVTAVKALMTLTDEERVFVGKESANNGEWVKISIQKVHTLLEIEDNDDRKSFLDYLCIDLNYVEEQRNNLLSKHRNLVHDINTCTEQLLVLKQAKLDLLTMQHVNTEILKENQNLRNKLKELTSITKAWLNSSNKVNQCIIEQIPTQKKKILGIDQLTEDTSSSGPKDLVFVKSLADNSEMSITGSNKPKLSGAEDFTLSNHDTVTDYDSTDESLVCSTPLPPLEKLTGAEPVSGPKTIKSNLKSKFTFKTEPLKGITINEPSSAPARGNKSSSDIKTNSAPAGKLKNVKIEDDLPLAIVMKELNELKLQFSKNKSSYFRNRNSQHVPLNALQNKYKTQFKMNCELCGQNNHLSKNCYEVLFCKKCKRTNHRTCDHADFMSSMDINQYHTGQSESSSRSRPSRPAIPFPSCIHCGYNDHQSDDCIYYLICEICGSYIHDTHGHNRIISLRSGIKPRNPQHITKNCETCGSNVHTTSDHNDIEWFRKREALQAKKAESFKANKTESSNALRSKTPTKRIGVLTYFLEFKIKQSERVISINKERYVNDLPRKYDKIGSSVNTPIMPLNMLGPNLNSKAVNESQYRAMFSAEAEDIAVVGCYAIILWIKS